MAVSLKWILDYFVFNDLLSNIQKPLGIHHIRTILFSLPVNYLKDLRHHVDFVASRT
jgi:hypothetical protein